MDCEKFDRVVLDLLYGELDELTDAAAKRHIEHCSRCKGIASGLRATREVGALVLVDPPESLELGILAAERRMNAKLPLGKKLGRGVSILAVYAMRPQLAMAALLLLMIGSSLFFLRSRPGGRDSVLITERGVPETEAEHVAIVPAPERREVAAAPAAAAAASAMPKVAAQKETPPHELLAEKAPDANADLGEGSKDEAAKGAAAEAEPLPGAEPALDSMEAATAAFQGGRYVEAQRRFEEIAARGGSEAPAAALQAVEALRRRPLTLPRHAVRERSRMASRRLLPRPRRALARAPKPRSPARSAGVQVSRHRRPTRADRARRTSRQRRKKSESRLPRRRRRADSPREPPGSRQGG
jgi:hypothetical protein